MGPGHVVMMCRDLVNQRGSDTVKVKLLTGETLGYVPMLQTPL